MSRSQTLMEKSVEIAITGLGCVTPIGTGREAFLSGLLAGKCAIQTVHQLTDQPLSTFRGAPIEDFSGKDFVRPRKALKVMSREVQLAYASAQLAWQDSFPGEERPEPDRMGVVFGSEMIPGEIGDVIPAVQECINEGVLDVSQWGQKFGRQVFPLWMLKNLPNMPACHVGIAVDARGPNNSIAQEEVSGLLALCEAENVFRRKAADVMLVGAIGSRLTPTRLLYRLRQIYDQHPKADSLADSLSGAAFGDARGGIVPSEGAVTLVTETLEHAQAREAPILGFVRGTASTFGRTSVDHGGSRRAIAQAVSASIQAAGVAVEDLSHISAQGFAGPALDIEEAEGIRAAVGDQVPVCVPSSYYGTAGAAAAPLHLAASLVALSGRQLLPAIGLNALDPACPVNVMRESRHTDKEHFVQVAFTPEGHASAAVIQCASQTT
ncbi:MAG: beta-ketoacyl synthase [Aureliella sp.]